MLHLFLIVELELFEHSEIEEWGDVEVSIGLGFPFLIQLNSRLMDFNENVDYLAELLVVLQVVLGY